MEVRRKYSKEMIDFLRENAKGKTSEELTSYLNDRFETDIPVKKVRSLLERFGIKSGVDTRFGHGNKSGNKFEKGNDIGRAHWFGVGDSPKNTREIGHEKIDAYGHIRVKTNLGWETKEAVEWKKIHGELPKGMIVIHKDGDLNNMAPENLMAVTRAEHAERNLYYGNTPPEMNETTYLLARIKSKIRENKRGG